MSVSRAKIAETRRVFYRLSPDEGGQHVVLVVGFTLLTITGFLVYIPDTWLEPVGAVGLVSEARMFLHRVGAMVLGAVSAYHLYYLAFKKAGRRFFRDMLPRLRDLAEARDNLAYYLGRRDHPPDFHRFNYRHKFEYYALWTGNLLMGATGVVLWSESYWNKFVLDIALVVHSMEAILACLAVMVWHLYEVHLGPHKYPLDTTWVVPTVSEEEMKALYPAHYREIMADPALRRAFVRDVQVDPPEDGTR